MTMDATANPTRPQVLLNRTVRATAVLAVTACGSLAGAASAAPLTCAALNGTKVPASAIGLPTHGATVTGATEVAGGGTGAKTFGPYCKLLANIAPVDPAAPPIKLQVNLRSGGTARR